MAADAVRQEPVKGKGPGWLTQLRDFYHDVMREMAKVTWPEMAQVRQATIAILIFVLLIALLIWLMDVALQGVLVKLIPSLFTGR